MKQVTSLQCTKVDRKQVWWRAQRERAVEATINVDKKGISWASDQGNRRTEPFLCRLWFGSVELYHLPLGQSLRAAHRGCANQTTWTPPLLPTPTKSRQKFGVTSLVVAIPFRFQSTSLQWLKILKSQSRWRSPS